MQHTDKPTIDQHISGFGSQDAFFSRTDERGVIQSGNQVFVRLSEYEWSDLEGAPHRIIRHPDMPKAVFHLMWQTLRAGKVFGGYVKNRTARGLYYWVFAVVAPVKGGFLSVRIKPGAETFDAVREVYGDLKADEEARGFDPVRAEVAVAELLSDLGYAGYEQFMTDALSKEIELREDLNTGPVPRNLRQFATMADRLVKLHGDVLEVNTLFEKIRTVPVNLHLAGTRQGEAGHAIQVVASNYADISDELRKSIEEMGEGLDRLALEAHTSRMSYCSAVMMRDAIAKFGAEEPVMDELRHEEEMRLVEQAFSAFLDTTAANCTRIRNDAKRFTALNGELRKHLSALSVTRVTCRIEAAALTNDREGIDEIANRLKDFQIQLGVLLNQIASDSGEISDSVPNFDRRALQLNRS